MAEKGIGIDYTMKYPETSCIFDVEFLFSFDVLYDDRLFKTFT